MEKARRCHSAIEGIASPVFHTPLPHPGLAVQAVGGNPSREGTVILNRLEEGTLEVPWIHLDRENHRCMDTRVMIVVI